MFSFHVGGVHRISCITLQALLNRKEGEEKKNEVWRWAVYETSRGSLPDKTIRHHLSFLRKVIREQLIQPHPLVLEHTGSPCDVLASVPGSFGFWPSELPLDGNTWTQNELACLWQKCTELYFSLYFLLSGAAHPGPPPRFGHSRLSGLWQWAVPSSAVAFQSEEVVYNC